MEEYAVEQPLVEIVEHGRKVLFASIVMMNIPGVLAKVSKVLADANVNILSGLVSAPALAKQAVWVFAADFTYATSEPEEVFEKIKEIYGVEKVEYGAKRYGKLVVPSFCVRLNMLGRGIIIQRKGWLREVNRAILEEFGTGGEALMFHAGFRAGYRIAEYWMDASGAPKDKLVELGLEIVRVLNWISRYEIVRKDLNRPELIFRVWDLIDCEPFRGRSEKAMSHYFRGAYSGFLSRVLGKNVILIETKCVAKGDPFCEFKLALTE